MGTPPKQSSATPESTETPAPAAKAPPPPAPAAEAMMAIPADASVRAVRLEVLGRNHILTAMGVGVVPVPVLDVLGVTAVQLDLIAKLSAEYGVEFRIDRARPLLTSLLAGVLPVALGGTVASILKFVPLVGYAAGVVALPILAGATTYAVHKVFVRHFDQGGTLKDFNVGAAKGYFAEQIKIGKKVAGDLRQSGDVVSEVA